MVRTSSELLQLCDTSYLWHKVYGDGYLVDSRRATKIVAGMQDFNYNDRLKILGLQRLEERRMRSDLIETFKIVNRKYDINPELFFQVDEGDRRGHDQKLFKKRFRLNVRKYAFSKRVIDNYWNLLPASCINCSTINTFKKHLSSELESEAVKFKVCQL